MGIAVYTSLWTSTGTLGFHVLYPWRCGVFPYISHICMCVQGLKLNRVRYVHSDQELRVLRRSYLLIDSLSLRGEI